MNSGSAPTPVAAGSRLADRYLLLHPIGTGGMGTVWRAADDVLDRHVAVKVLAAALTDDPEFRQRLRREARAAARLDHPHITRVYDYGEVAMDGQTVQYLVMELLSGPTLAARLQAGPLAVTEVAKIGAEVAEAVAIAHARGVIHRDITPGNIMLTPAGTKLLDFGISTVAGDAAMTAVGRTLGTPAYLAPERIAGRPATAAADVYALAAVLTHAVTGHTVYRGNWSEQAHAHLHDEPVLEDVPTDLVSPLRACLAKDPHVRPAAAEVALALRSISTADRPAYRVPASASVPPPRAEQPVRRASPTQVLPAYGPGSTEAAERVTARPGALNVGKMATWAAVAFLAIAIGLLAASALGDGGRPSQNPSDRNISATTFSPSSSPELVAPTSSEEAIGQLRDIVSAALANGDITPRLATDIGRTLVNVVSLAERGRYRDANRRLEDLSHRLAERNADGDLSASAYQDINSRIDYLREQIPNRKGKGHGNEQGNDGD
ncbi:MAG TPA: protein kinase [Actinomycetes bacterium]